MKLETVYIIITLFGITTIMGLYLSSLVLRNKKTSKTVIIFHGLFSIAGFTLLISHFPESLESIMFLSVATLFGLVLLYQYITRKIFTKWLCYAHGIFTITGFAFLLALAWYQS